jgi:hypothetical protein
MVEANMKHRRGWGERVVLVLTVSLFVARAAQAQEETSGVAGSGMEQGSGAITTRSDVTMSVESLPGTSALRLGAIGEAIGTQMPQLRACYVEVLEQRPTVQGDLQVQIRIAEGRGGSVTLEVARDTLGDSALTDCLLNSVRRAPLMTVRGPSGGLLVMHFQNTAAEGAALVARERERASSTISRVDGHPRAQASTPSGEVEVVIDGADTTNEDSVAALFRTVQARIGTMLDCRRRASRRGQNPEGEIILSFTVPHRGAAIGRTLSSTVADPTASSCILRSLVLASRGQSDAAGSYRVTLRFAGL